MVLADTVTGLPVAAAVVVTGALAAEAVAEVSAVLVDAPTLEVTWTTVTTVVDPLEPVVVIAKEEVGVSGETVSKEAEFTGVVLSTGVTVDTTVDPPDVAVTGYGVGGTAGDADSAAVVQGTVVVIVYVAPMESVTVKTAVV